MPTRGIPTYGKTAHLPLCRAPRKARRRGRRGVLTWSDAPPCGRQGWGVQKSVGERGYPGGHGRGGGNFSFWVASWYGSRVVVSVVSVVLVVGEGWLLMVSRGWCWWAM